MKRTSETPNANRPTDRASQDNQDPAQPPRQRRRLAAPAAGAQQPRPGNPQQVRDIYAQGSDQLGTPTTAVVTAAELARKQKASGERLDPLLHMTARLVGEGHVPDPLVMAGLAPPVSLSQAPSVDLPTYSASRPQAPVPDPLAFQPTYAKPIEQPTEMLAQEFLPENSAGLVDADWARYMDDLIEMDSQVAPGLRQSAAPLPASDTGAASRADGDTRAHPPAAAARTDLDQKPSASQMPPALNHSEIRPLAAAPVLPTGFVATPQPAPLSSSDRVNLSRLLFHNPHVSHAQIAEAASGPTSRGGLGRPIPERQVAELADSAWYRNIVRHRPPG